MMAITRKVPRGSHHADEDNDRHQIGKGRQDRSARNDTEKEGANIAQSGQRKLSVSDEGGTAVDRLDDSADGDNDRHQTTKKATGQQNRSAGNDTEQEGANIVLSDQKKLSASDEGGTAVKGLNDSADGDNDSRQMMKKAKGRRNRSACNDTEQEGANIEQSGQKKNSASDDVGTAAKGLDVSDTDKTSSTKGKSGKKKRSASIDSASPKKRTKRSCKKGDNNNIEYTEEAGFKSDDEVTEKESAFMTPGHKTQVSKNDFFCFGKT